MLTGWWTWPTRWRHPAGSGGCEVDALVVVPTGRDTLGRTAVPALTGRILEWEPAP